MKFFVCTFGCRCNQADSAAMRESLNRKSMNEAERPEDAGLVIVNTCTVTGRTDQQVRQALRKLHRENPEARLVVTGCYAERDPEALAAIPGVDLVIGNADRDRVADILIADGFETTGRIIHSPLDAAQDCLVAPMMETGGRTRPFIKLQDGCDARCSYCIVPFVRGPGRGARPEDVLGEVENLVRAGYQEIVLTGVNLGTYGRKMRPRTTLAQLLRRILENPELGRLRLSSIEPMRFSSEILQIAAGDARFAPHFHIPLQSGSDRILRMMRRPYRSARFLDLLAQVHEALPDAGIGTDILVGFPGETEEDFAATCAIVGQSPLTYMHVFPFSPRAGTDAPGMGKLVPPPVVRERAGILRDISREKNLEFRRRFLGQSVPALTLAREEEMGQSVVLTENYIHARVPDTQIPPNRLVKVVIQKVEPGATFGAVETAPA
jgi:threonylcarbamoyladenosine tRNA methylthiotransferase MtaB